MDELVFLWSWWAVHRGALEEVKAAALMVINTVLREFTFLTFPALLCAVV